MKDSASRHSGILSSRRGAEAAFGLRHSPPCVLLADNRPRRYARFRATSQPLPEGSRHVHAQRQDSFYHRREPGIGLAIALRAAQDGANVAVVAKTVDPHPRLPGTIHTAVSEIEKAGGRGLAPAPPTSASRTRCKRRPPKTAETFGGIDILHQ